MPSMSGAVMVSASVKVTEENTPLRRRRCAARASSAGSKRWPDGKPAILRTRSGRIWVAPFTVRSPKRRTGPGFSCTATDRVALA